jgi:aldehyde dehydrogenase (NAD+)
MEQALHPDYHELVQRQNDFFNTNETKDPEFRIRQLKLLKSVLKSNEKLLDEAIYKDFRKSSFENYVTELSIIYHEINLAMGNLKDWSRKKRVSTPASLLPGKSYILPEPLGTTLIIGAWNYPYQLSILPAVSALAAGNTAIIKPSELAMNTSNIIARIINDNFDERVLKVVEGGVPETTALLNERFDKIFYTGGGKVARIIMRAAAEHLTPVTLELGGKSPAFVFGDTQIKTTAKRLVWAKFLNGGQTCVAPDYLLVEKGVKEKLIEEIGKQITAIHGENPKESEAFVRIINPRHFERIMKLIDRDKVVIGGENDPDDLYIAPTVLDKVRFDDAVMQEEIFGPVLPVIEFDDLDWAIAEVKNRDKPLSLYIFTSSKKIVKKILHEVSFGGGAVNDAVMHLANSALPFGGVGESGTGSYHGKSGFDNFSHFKSVYHHSPIFEPNLKYPPYTKSKLKILRMMME